MTRPGLVKVRAAPLVVTRKAILVRTSARRWAEIFDRADIISEGRIRDEAEGRVWYGSTSFILHAEGHIPLLAALVRRDAHLRLRAIRVAHREAAVRSPARLGRLVCEIQVTSEVEGIRIDVDVQAPLIESRTDAQRAP